MSSDRELSPARVALDLLERAYRVLRGADALRQFGLPDPETSFDQGWQAAEQRHVGPLPAEDEPRRIKLNEDAMGAYRQHLQDHGHPRTESDVWLLAFLEGHSRAEQRHVEQQAADKREIADLGRRLRDAEGQARLFRGAVERAGQQQAKLRDVLDGIRSLAALRNGVQAPGEGRQSFLYRLLCEVDARVVAALAATKEDPA